MLKCTCPAEDEGVPDEVEEEPTRVGVDGKLRMVCWVVTDNDDEGEP